MTKMLGCLFLAVSTFSAAHFSAAQTPASASAESKNPVVWAANDVYQRQARFIVAAAEEMPADKFSYKPTPDQWTYAKIISHIALANAHVCGMLNDTKAPATLTVADTASKSELIAGLKASFDFCNAAMAVVQDAQLGDTITFFGGRKTPLSRALIEEVGDLEDHYSQMAAYLRLNGLIPPSAAPRK